MQVRALYIVMLGGLAALMLATPASAIDVAGELVVELRADDDSAGGPVWENLAPDPLVGDFIEVGDPFVEVIQGVDAVTFNSTGVLDAYQSELAPVAPLVGLDPTRSIEVWVYNPAPLPNEETLVAWGHRGGNPDGSNMSFNYGTNGAFGAVGHWGAPDIGWNDAGGAPAPGVWHHLAYTYDGTTTRVYSDGVEQNSEVLGAGIINTHTRPDLRITLAAQIFIDDLDTAQLDFGLRGVLSLARVRVHTGALTASQVLNNYEEECAEICPVEAVPACLDCPADDSLFEGKTAYLRRITLDAFPPITSVELTSPPDAVLEMDVNFQVGRLTYLLPDPEPISFNVSIEATNPLGTSTFSWTVDLVERPPAEDIETAGELFVDLDAAHESAGTPIWLNAGTQADFVRIGEPLPTVLGPEDSPAVEFNALSLDDAYQCLENAAAGLTGLDPTRSVEVWVYNPTIETEECILAWGRRGGPCGTNASFNYGTDAYFGAVGHWCHDPGPDLGWINPDEIGVAEIPLAGEWHHLVYTYDGETTRVYADGVLENSEFLGAGIINTWPDFPITLAAQIVDDSGALNLGDAIRTGTLALGQVRVHDGVLSLGQIRTNFDLERDRYGVGEIPPQAPEFPDAPAADTALASDDFYTRHLSVGGFPTASLEALDPAGATITPDGLYSYDIPDPAPVSFTVTVRATNTGGEATATWDVTIVQAEDLLGGPVHVYAFATDASDSVGAAHGTPYGDVTFEDGRAILNNTGLESSNDDPPGAYIDLPNGIISALGQQATFELWATRDGVETTIWQRFFDFGSSAGGEDVSDGAAQTANMFLTPYSGTQTTRFGYRTGAFGFEERIIEGPPLKPGEEYHLAVVWDEVAGTTALYINGYLEATGTTHFTLAELVDVNNWLGRSQYPDAMLDGSYDEFRIYDYPLTQGMLVQRLIDGPTADEPGGTQFARGDADANGGAANITDGIYVLNFLFLGGPPPPCRDSADADDNGDVNITDGIYILNFLFLGGPPPPAPAAPNCGEDTTPSELTCESFPPCE